MTTYQPELGQMAFGANFHPTAMANYVQAGLRRLGAAVAPESDSGADPTDNTGAVFENGVFAIRGFCWCDGESDGHQEGCPPNFEFAGLPAIPDQKHEARALVPFEADWYKYLGRGSSQSRKVSGAEWTRIEAACLASVAGSGSKNTRVALEQALAPLSPWPASVSVGPDGAQIFLGLALPAELEPDFDSPDWAGIETLVAGAETAIARAVKPLGFGPPAVLGKDDRYWLAMPFPPDFDDSDETSAYWRDMSAEELDEFHDANEREPFSDERWTPIRHSAINLRRGLARL